MGLLDFAIHPHLDHEWFPSYAIDDPTAIKVKDGVVEVISEGKWELFAS